MKFKKFKFKKVNNTNNTAINIIKSSNTKYGMVISEKQKNGKGQYGRKWISLKGNLFVSLFYNIDEINLSLKQLTKKNCIIVKKLISKFYKKKIIFKEPNDLLINNKKVCGILQETITKEKHKYIIVGIGINIIKNPNIKNYQTTNLTELVGKKVDYKLVASLIKSMFEKNLLKYYK